MHTSLDNIKCTLVLLRTGISTLSKSQSYILKIELFSRCDSWLTDTISVHYNLQHACPFILLHMMSCFQNFIIFSTHLLTIRISSGIILYAKVMAVVAEIVIWCSEAIISFFFLFFTHLHTGLMPSSGIC